MITPHKRFSEYTGEKCWQGHLRDMNLESDIRECSLNAEEIKNLKVDDFYFSYVDKSDTESCSEIKTFIEKHEWLGKLQQRSTHRFVARLKSSDELAGVVVMSTPNAFSNLLGRENKDKEKLISRGACISWGPKNLGSWLIMSSIRWMVDNTEFRYFTAYSDPEARELGTIYQACNFIYLGQTSGANKQYLDPDHPEKGWFSDREFRKRTKYKKYAEKIGIPKQQWESYMGRYSPNWDIVPEELKEKIKLKEKEYRDSCLSRTIPAKHKYVYILGRNKSETKKYRKMFQVNNPSKINLDYPTERGV